jgi:hypothetical protein
MVRHTAERTKRHRRKGEKCVCDLRDISSNCSRESAAGQAERCNQNSLGQPTPRDGPRQENETIPRTDGVRTDFGGNLQDAERASSRHTYPTNSDSEAIAQAQLGIKPRVPASRDGERGGYLFNRVGPCYDRASPVGRLVLAYASRTGG